MGRPWCTRDMVAMWVFWIVELAATVALIVIPIVIQTDIDDDAMLLPAASMKTTRDRASYVTQGIVVSGVLNLLTTLIAGWYFSTLAKDLGNLLTVAELEKGAVFSAHEKCRGVRLDDSPNRLYAMIGALMIIVSGLGALSLSFALGLVGALRWVFEDARPLVHTQSSTETYDSRVSLGNQLVAWIVVAVVARVVTIFIGHTWAILRTKCLQNKLE